METILEISAAIFFGVPFIILLGTGVINSFSKIKKELL